MVDSFPTLDANDGLAAGDFDFRGSVGAGPDGDHRLAAGRRRRIGNLGGDGRGVVDEADADGAAR